MDSRQFRRVKALYRMTVDLDEAARRELLERMCPDDAEVREDVLRLGAASADERLLDDLLRRLADALKRG